ALAACAIAAAAAYWNSLIGAWALDDFHSIVDNPCVRSLSFIPRYFRDPDTFTTLKPNVDYRPVLQATYALDYWLSDALRGSGYDVVVWHVTSLLMHVVVAWSIFLLGRRLFGTGGVAPVGGLSRRAGDRAALLAAVLFAVHPIGSECADYISDRSSLLV